MWDADASPTSNFRYKIANYTGMDSNSFNWSGSVTTFTNVPISNNTAINLFNYSYLSNLAFIHYFVQVPSEEPPGNKTSLTIFTGWSVAS